MTKIALVGHCGVDGPRIAARINDILDDVEVCYCNDPESLDAALDEGANLLLFNRALGFGFDDATGVDVMADVRASHPDAKLMLISDYDHAQRDARHVGALPGFGKSDLGSSKVEEALRGALSGSA